MARKVDVVRPRALRDVIEFPSKHRPTVALGVALTVAAVALGFALGFIAARLWGGR